jgi:hypothetical protein
MKTMEKKSYFKPVITRTEIDYSITLTQVSQNTPAPNNGPYEVPSSPPDEVFINPFKWFR